MELEQDSCFDNNIYEETEFRLSEPGRFQRTTLSREGGPQKAKPTFTNEAAGRSSKERLARVESIGIVL